MDARLVVAGAVFVLTYALISVRRVRGVNIRMPYATAIGAVLMVLLGIVSPGEAAGAVDTGTILLLLGMMLLTASLETSGFFGILVSMLMHGARDGRRLLAVMMCASALMSALMLNDAVVLLMTPAAIGCCRRLKADPVPFLVGLFVSANIGSAATAVGNPQNAYIASVAGIGFAEFSMYMAPLALMCLIVSYLILARLFRGRLWLMPAAVERPETDPARLKAMCVLLIATVIAFALSDAIGTELWAIGLCAGIIAFLIASTRGVSNAKRAALRVDWGVLVFFIGLFVVMAGAVSSGLVDIIAGLFPGFSDGDPSIGELTVFTAVLSNLISNVPAVVLIGEMIPAGSTALWMTLAASSTLAGNMTLIGAAANVIVEEEAEKEGVSIRFFGYLKAGVPVCLATLVLTWVWCSLVF